jgi:hypothetical protein
MHAACMLLEHTVLSSSINAHRQGGGGETCNLLGDLIECPTLPSHPPKSNAAIRRGILALVYVSLFYIF